MVAAAMKLLKPGGRFILTCPHDNAIPDPEHLRIWGHDELFHLLAPYSDTVSFTHFPPPWFHIWMLAYLAKRPAQAATEATSERDPIALRVEGAALFAAALAPGRRLGGTDHPVVAGGFADALAAPDRRGQRAGRTRPVPAPETSIGHTGHQRVGLLFLAVLGSLLLALMMNGLHVVSNYINTRIDQHITLDFRSQLFLHAQRMSLAFHDRRRSGMIIYMINSQGSAPAGLIMAMPVLAEAALTLVGMFWISFRMDWTLSLASLAVVPFLYYSVGYYATHIQGRLQHVQGLEMESLSVMCTKASP